MSHGGLTFHFLMADDIEHFIIYLLAIHINSFQKGYLSHLIQFLIWLFGFLLLNWERYLVSRMFFHNLLLTFSFFNILFKEHEFIILMKIPRPPSLSATILFMLPAVAGITGTHHQAQFFLLSVVSWTYYLILPILSLLPCWAAVSK
jgi:hypothetical protein